MLIRFLLILGTAATLGACAAPQADERQAAWDHGTWNSVLGYHGPHNTMAPNSGR